MNALDLQSFLSLSRRKTLELLDALTATPEATALLVWRPGPGRATITWHLMHIAATDDRHLNVRFKGGEPLEPEYVRRYGVGSVPDEEPVSVEVMRRYLTEQRENLLNHLRGLTEEDLKKKPSAQVAWTYEEWFQTLAWHEAHHHGQAHLTYNLYRAAHEMKLPKMGH